MVNNQNQCIFCGSAIDISDKEFVCDKPECQRIAGKMKTPRM